MAQSRNGLCRVGLTWHKHDDKATIKVLQLGAKETPGPIRRKSAQTTSSILGTAYLQGELSNGRSQSAEVVDDEDWVCDPCCDPGLHLQFSERLRYLKPSTGFRENPQYNNTISHTSVPLLPDKPLFAHLAICARAYAEVSGYFSGSSLTMPITHISFCLVSHFFSDVPILVFGPRAQGGSQGPLLGTTAEAQGGREVAGWSRAIDSGTIQL
ncbi:hypothetical protein C8R45DRAFT_937768 [Mycena sanguinolenta]|nr:hypothetical protein C8R45DRAFT_937768 [Mycena sanguinolenta]